MWKKTENEPAVPAASPAPGRRPRAAGEVSTLGPSILIKGDLTGQEDLVIRGKLQGEVRLEKNNVTVGQSGHIKADIYGKNIRVEGEVDGNLYGGQQVVISDTGRVEGNIVSPSVTLQNGSKFRGAIDMEPGETRAPRTPHGAPSQPKKAPAPTESAAEPKSVEAPAKSVATSSSTNQG